MRGKSRFWTDNHAARWIDLARRIHKGFPNKRTDGVEQKLAEVRVVASQQNWIEGSAVRQLEKTAALPGMRLAVGLPDLHPGKRSE